MIAALESQVRVLFIEDELDDVELELAALREAGLGVAHHVVETAEDLRRALESESWDLIICDYSMPALSGFDALRIAKQVAPDTPVILVSGTVGEDVAVEAMRAGAQDYVLKQNLFRLASAVQRELREAESRRRGRISLRGLQLLADVGAVLGTSLDAGSVPSRLPRAMVGDFGELCIIDVIDEERAIQRAASAHVDPAKEELLRRLEQEYPRHHDHEPADLALSKRAPVVLDRLADMDAGGAYGACVRIARELGLGAVLSIPLLAHDRVVGAINLARRRPYSPLEIEIVVELSGRIAVSIDNARLYERAKAAVQLRDDFLSIASHELKTPLTAVQLQVQGLQELARKGAGMPLDERLSTRLERCTRNLSRLARLVESLLDVSRISTGRLELNLDQFDMVMLAREVAERFREEARQAGTDLHVTAPAKVVGRWDRLRLEQALTNLLSNAIKYGAAKPIELAVSKRDDQVVLEVVDHGIGIPAEDFERIFGRFERAVSARNYGGLGLGLFITRQVAHAHGGTIRAQPTSGGGATFTLTLPCEASASAPEAGG